MARALGPDARLPTVLQLRDTLCTSVATVDSVLKELEAQKVLYRRHGVGIFVSPSLDQRVIGLVCAPEFLTVPGTSPFWELLVRHARARAESCREELAFHFAAHASEEAPPARPQLQDGLATDVAVGRLDGLILVGLSKVTADWVEAQGVPCVAFAGPGPCTVATDGCELVRLAARALVDQGCRRVALWSPLAPYRRPLEKSMDPPEVAALCGELEAQGIPYVASLTCRGGADPAGPVGPRSSHQEQGFQTAHRVFAVPREQWPDGLIIADDMMTLGALAAFDQLGVRPGVDVRVVSHANRGSTALLGREQGLMLLEMDPEEVVQGLFDLLETRLHGREPEEPHLRVQPRWRLPEASQPAAPSGGQPSP
jgi:DNA-binding LacI/PurR family transcriptional regulator